MADRLYDALEICLQVIEEGQTIDSAVKLYPDLESELRPILEASLQARTLAASSVPSVVQRRGRTHLLQRAAELRQLKRVPAKRRLPAFQRLAVTLGLVSVLVLSSTGLVGASSNSLPGDQLYPVKRTWEDVQLNLVFNQPGRETLQSQFEQERLNEIDELLTQNRSQPVTFSGLVINRQDGTWLVSGISVLVTSKTQFSSAQILNNVPVIVIGTTRSDGVLEADQIEPLQPGSMLPPLEPSHTISNNGESQNAVTTVIPTPAESPIILQTPAAPSATPQSFTYTGIVQSEEGNNWTINGQNVSVNQGDVNGKINVGDAVKFEGYSGDNGNFVVTNIEADSQKPSSHPNEGGKGSGSSGGGGDSNGGKNNGGGDNANGGGDHGGQGNGGGDNGNSGG